MQFMIFCIISFSMAWIISKEYIFKWFRDMIKNKFLKKLICCPNCLSVWVGFILSPFFIFNEMILLNTFFGGMISYFFMKIMTIIIDKNTFTLDE